MRQEDTSPLRPTRRSVLRLGGGAVVASALGASPAYAATGTGTAPLDGPSATGRPVRGAGRAPAAPDRPFDLSGAATRWIHEKRLQQTTVLQSFAFDEDNRHIYALQVIRGGVQLPGEPRAYTHAERTRSGDLCLNRLSMDGDVLGHMYLKGFGHGSAMGVEPLGSGRFALWTECDADPQTGHARGIGRYRYAENTILHCSDPGVAIHRPQPGSISNSAAIDLHGRRLLLRYRRADGVRFAVYDFDLFRRGSYRPIVDFPQPGAELGLPFQGMTLYGDYAYQVIGAFRDPDDPDSEEVGINGRLYCMDLSSGGVIQELRTRSVDVLLAREPEGLAVLHTPRPRLCMGYASGPVGGRKYSLYYKEAPEPDPAPLSPGP
ncbi:teichoic acid biosynthesis protein C [Streptomyces sp. bgisy100]|uniref:phage baseplate protein n=1 Tax=Streptomyces sp. bgisy100 TaxID=3413783 RepID=UPI003D748AB8